MSILIHLLCFEKVCTKHFSKKELQYKVASFELFHAKYISYTEQHLRGNIILRVIKLNSASLLMYRPSTVRRESDGYNNNRKENAIFRSSRFFLRLLLKSEKRKKLIEQIQNC